jgi:Fur family peroxide stress response transcriptional regulator
MRCTQQRLEVFRAVIASGEHPGALEVFETVRRNMPTVSLDTIYRTLRALSGIGLINPVGSSADKIRFEASASKHHHFVCACCGGITDFTSRFLDGIPTPDEARALGRAWGSRMEVRGICSACCTKVRFKERGEHEDGRG